MGPERQEKAGGMFMGLCARAKRRVGLQKGGQHGKCWNTQDSVILFPKWCSAVLLQGSQTLTCGCPLHENPGIV